LNLKNRRHARHDAVVGDVGLLKACDTQANLQNLRKSAAAL